MDYKQLYNEPKKGVEEETLATLEEKEAEEE
jgi:hypothetical protein